MFGKLLAKIQNDKPSHPLATDGGIDAILAEIPIGNPVHRLLDLAQWLDDVERFRDEVGLAALCRAILRFDAFAKPARDELIAGYLDPGSPHHLSEAVWGQLDAHVRMLAKAYDTLLKAALTPAKDLPGKPEQAACAAQAMRVLVQAKKLQRFRYRNPDPGWWQAAHAVLADATALGVHAAVVPLHGNAQERRSPLQCYLAGVYLELAPLGNLVPQQVEVLDRFLESNIEQLELVAQRHPGSTHAIDLAGSAGPFKLTASDPGGATVRFCSVRRAQIQALRLAAQLRSATALPEWVTQASCDAGRLQSLLMSLILGWSEKPPQRAATRQPGTGQLKVVHGFDLARRMISYSGYARLGHLPDYDGIDLDALFQEARFGRVRNINEPEVAADDTPAPPPDPLDILEHLELSGDRQMMENWLLVDASATGIGAVAPGLLTRHGIGGLVCFRRGDDIEWRIGFIRRIGRDAKRQPSIGLETSGGQAICGRAGPPEKSRRDDDTQAFLGRTVDAILPAGDGDEILVPAGTYQENLAAEIGTADGTRDIVFGALTESGGDFERIKFRPAQTGEGK